MMMAMVDRGSARWQFSSTWNSDFRDSDEMRFLPELFVPGKWDVICHSGKESQEHVGNRRFNLCVQNHLQSYARTDSRPARSAIITNIVASIRDASEGGFIRLDLASGRWYEVGDKMARDKVGQALRDAMNSDTKSGTTQAQRKRKRCSSGDSNSPNTKQRSASASPRQTIAANTNPRHPLWSNSNEMPLFLNPHFESTIQPKSRTSLRENRSSWHDANGRGTMPRGCKSSEATTTTATGQADEASQSPGDITGNSGKTSSSDSNQLSLFEWFERDVQNALF